MVRYEILSRHPDFVEVRFYHPEWKEKHVKNGVDQNPLQPHVHRVRMPLPVEGEDFEQETLPRQIMVASQSAKVKIEAKAGR